MKSGFVGEIFSSIQGEGLYVGRRQVFVRFAGCNLSCIYCDTAKFRRPVKYCRIERNAGVSEIRENPVGSAEIFQEVLRLTTPDTHSVSLTGGEPLLAVELAREVARLCRKASLPIYLETNGSLPEAMRKIVKFVDYASIDVKLPEHKAVEPERWRFLLEKEISCIRIARKTAETFVKIVVLPSTKEATISSVCGEIADLDVPVVIQPVTPAGKIGKSPSKELLLKLSEAAALAGVRDVAVIPQVHKFIGFR